MKEKMSVKTIPSHLKSYGELYGKNPLEAALKWFKDAKFGLFVHYALASLLKCGKPGLIELMDNKKYLIENLEASPEELDEPDLSEEEKKKCLETKNDLMSRFTAENFDAEVICDLAEAANMRYVTFTTRHLGGMYMFDTSVTEFKVTNSAAGRDLVKEVSEACARRGLGYFHYVPPHFARTDSEHFKRNHTMLRELLTNYSSVVGIWFDGIGKYHQNPENYKNY